MFDRIDLVIGYRKNGKKYTVRLLDGGNADLGFALNKDEEHLDVEVIPEGEVQIDWASLTTAFYYVPHYRVYLGAKYSGASRETTIYGQSKKQLLRYINKVSPKKVPLKRLTSYSYTYVRDREVYSLFGSLDDSQAFTEFHHRPERKSLEIVRHFQSLTISKSEFVFRLFYKKGGYDEVFNSYLSPLLPDYKPAKYLVGYNLLGSKKAPLTDNAVDAALKMVNDFSNKFDTLILENYRRYEGDWNELDPNLFNRDLHQVADAIAKCGLKPGIEVKPFSVDPRSRAAIENRRMLEKDIIGRPLLRNGFYHYDICNSEAVLYLTDCFKTLIAAGFTVFKVGGLQSYIAGRDEASRGYLVTRLMRDATAGHTLILCNAPILASVGNVDYCGVAGHVIDTWDGSLLKRLFRMNGNHSTLNAIMNTMARRHLDGKVFRTYPSRLSFLHSNSKFTKDQKAIMLKISSLFGGSLLLTDNLYNYDDATKEAFAKLMETRNTKVTRVISPLKNVMQIEYLDGEVKHIFSFDYRKGKIINSI